MSNIVVVSTFYDTGISNGRSSDVICSISAGSGNGNLRGFTRFNVRGLDRFQIIITRANKSWTLFFVRIKVLINVYFIITLNFKRFDFSFLTVKKRKNIKYGFQMSEPIK